MDHPSPELRQRVVSARLSVDLRPIRWLGGVMLALGLSLPHLPGSPGLPCPLRTVTGVPCPFCGLTTSVEAALGGHGRAALGANPFGPLLVVIAVVALIRPHWRQVSVPTVLLGGGIALSWLFELHRFHFV